MKKKLKAVNSVKVVNTWEVSILRYTSVCINWRKCEFPPVDKKIRKLFTLYRGLFPKSDVGSL